jgi:ribosomal protein L12E/L44/L45/RPP1/RPP2
MTWVRIQLEDEVHRRVKAKAALAGKSLKDYLAEIADKSTVDILACQKMGSGAVKRTQPAPIRERRTFVTEEEAARGLSDLFG